MTMKFVFSSTDGRILRSDTMLDLTARLLMHYVQIEYRINPEVADKSDVYELNPRTGDWSMVGMIKADYKTDIHLDDKADAKGGK